MIYIFLIWEKAEQSIAENCIKICSTHLNLIHIVYHSWTQMRMSAFKLRNKNVVMVYEPTENWREIASKSDTNQEFCVFHRSKWVFVFCGGWFSFLAIYLVFEFLDLFKRNSFVKNGIAYKWQIYRMKRIKEGVCGCVYLRYKRSKWNEWFSYWKPSGLLIDN